MTKCVRIINRKESLINSGIPRTHATPRNMHHALQTAVVILWAVGVTVVNNSRATAVGVTVGVKEEH